jgi:hypothetical protein
LGASLKETPITSEKLFFLHEGITNNAIKALYDEGSVDFPEFPEIEEDFEFGVNEARMTLTLLRACIIDSIDLLKDGGPEKLFLFPTRYIMLSSLLLCIIDEMKGEEK